MSSLPDFVEPLGAGVYAIDTGFQRPRFDAAFLVVDGGRAAFIDTGTNHAVPRLLAALDALGLSRDAVDWVIPTHVHLDHAGGCGLLMASLPKARALVHPRGLRHMIDPSALYAGALAVYGAQEMEASYGTLVGIPAERAEASADGMVVHVGQRPLLLIDTPGHARHHHCIWDLRTAGWFTGDTFGLSYREFDDPARGPWILPTCTPVQFEPELLKASIRRLLERQPRRMYLTHYSAVDNVVPLAQALMRQIDDLVEIGGRAPSPPQRHDWLVAELGRYLVDGAQAHGCTWPAERIRQALAMDIELNAQGLAIWLDRQARPAG